MSDGPIAIGNENDIRETVDKVRLGVGGVEERDSARGAAMEGAVPSVREQQRVGGSFDGVRHEAEPRAKPLSQSRPAEFLELAHLYEVALNTAVDARLCSRTPTESDAIQQLGMCLGELEGDARDVIELHTCGLRAAMDRGNNAMTAVCLEEARLMTLELMGKLANFYQSYYLARPARYPVG